MPPLFHLELESSETSWMNEKNESFFANVEVASHLQEPYAPHDVIFKTIFDILSFTKY